MLKQAKLHGGPVLRNFEAMDMIHERMRERTKEGLQRLEPLIKKQIHSLYYEKKPNIYILTQEKQRMDDLNVERLLKKTQMPVNLLTQEEEEIKKIAKNFNINIKGMTLPYRLKIN